MTDTNLQYLRRKQLNSIFKIELSLNLGSSYALVVDITEWLMKDDGVIDISEGIIDTSGEISGELISKVELKFDNTRGDFEPNGRFFAGGFINNSKIIITSQYAKYSYSGKTLIMDEVLTPFIFKGILKLDSSTWDNSLNPVNRVFIAGVLQENNILTSELVIPGYISSGSMAEVVYQILQQPNIKKIIASDPDNITLGNDIAGVIDNPSEIVNKKVLDIINQIGILSNSKWYIDSVLGFVFEPIKNSGTSSWDIQTDDLINIDELGYNPLQFNSITWDDGVSPILNVKMPYDTRQAYGYDIFNRKFAYKFIEDVDNRLQLMNAYLLQNQHHHRQITITCKTNPEVRANQLITVDFPKQYGPNLGNDFIWGKSSWGDGSLWGIGIPGFSISTSILWRVISISRKLNLAPDMQIVAVQAGIGADVGL